MAAVVRIDAQTLRDGTEALATREPALAGIVDRYGHPPLWVRAQGFDTLVRIILEQQVSLASAKAVYQRARLACGGKRLTATGVRALGEEGLRRSGFTRQKAQYVFDLAVATGNGEVRLAALDRRTAADARAALLALRGVGPWTADVYCLVALRAADIWPHGDVALADAAHRVLGLSSRPSQEWLTRHARQWAPWRSVAARLLWHYYLSAKRDGATA